MLYYNERKDSIDISIKDSLHNYLLTQYKNNGDTVTRKSVIRENCPGAKYGLFGECFY